MDAEDGTTLINGTFEFFRRRKRESKWFQEVQIDRMAEEDNEQRVQEFPGDRRGTDKEQKILHKQKKEVKRKEILAESKGREGRT